MNISALKSHFANWREWEANPIVIKELRQAVRSWTVTGMLLLFLTVLFITSIVFLVTHLFENDPGMGLGGSMFEAFMFILAAASVFFIPLYVGIRVGVERQEGNPDLLYVSTLSPARIIRGKFFCGAYMALLFFSACMPFMAFTNLLRGVVLPTVSFILFCLFLMVCVANMAAIFLACLPVSRPFKILLALYGLFQSFGLIIPLVVMSFEFMRSGVGSMLFGRDFWGGALSFIGVTVALIGFFYVLSVALISPPSSNRALSVRLYMTAIWILGGIVAFAWVIQSKDAYRMLGWAVPTLILMVLALLVTVSNTDTLSVRVQRAIPTSKTLRAPAFLFFNGAAGGLIWVAILLAVTFLVTDAVILKFPKTGMRTDSAYRLLPTLAAYAFDYALLALFIHRTFLPRRAPKIAGVLVVMLAGVWAIAPSVVLFFLNKLSWKAVEGLQLGNAFNVMTFHDSGQLLAHQLFAFIWLAIMVLLNARWFMRQARQFHPPIAAPPVIE